MKLSEIKTPWERRKILKYKSDGNALTTKAVNVRHVAENVYRGEDQEEGWQTTAPIYVFFPGGEYGVEVWPMGIDHDVEYALWNVAGIGYTSAADLLESTLDRISKNGWVNLLGIEFLSQFFPEYRETLVSGRKNYLDKLEKAQEAERERQEAEEREKEEKKRKEDAEKRALYEGFADDMNPLQFGKMHVAMEKLMRLDGKTVLTRRDIIKKLCREGWKPARKDGVFAFKRGGGTTKPKTEYRMVKEGQAEYYLVTKIEHDFAQFLTA